MKVTLIILMALLGLGAIYGGGLLILSPSGEILGLPISMLEPSPFNDFLIPGLILFTVLGVLPCINAYGLISKKNNKFAETLNLYSDMHWSWTFSIYISIFLIMWIQLQMMFIDGVFWVHTLYVFWANLMIVFALHPNVRIQFRNESRITIID